MKITVLDGYFYGLADDEQRLCHSSIGYNSDSKPCSSGLNAEGIVKKNQNGVMDDIKGNDGDSDPSLYLENTRNGWPASKLNGNAKEIRDFVTSSSCSSKKMDSFQDSIFYLDKSVMECELPELVVCYKESTYHVVKDICIDEGVPTPDKFLFVNGVDEKSVCNFLPSEKDQDSGKLMKEKLNADTCMQDVSLSLEENESNKGIPNRCDSKDLMLTREVKDDAMKMITDDGSKELFTLGELLSMPEFSSMKSEAMSSDRETDGIEQKSFQNSSEKEVMVTPPSVSAVEESNNSSEEATLSAPALVATAEESDSRKGEATMINPAQALASEESTSSNLVNEVSYDSKLDFDSSAPTSSKGEGRHNRDREPLDTVSKPKLEDTTDQPFSNNLQRGNRESSFSASGPLTGLISYSGPITYSGNLSLRSDSSTTSTHSFAFPILQPEWNSSPVRMAKADQKHYRKHRGWTQGLLCCRF